MADNYIPGQGYQTRYGYGVQPVVQANVFKDAKGTKLYPTFEQMNSIISQAIDNAFNTLYKTSFSTYLSDTYGISISTLQSQLDGKVETYYTDTDPNTWAEADRTKHNGDMWYAPTSKVLKRYDGTTNTWSTIEDQTAVDAYTNAATAQDTADGKRRVFTTTPATPYDIGDLWSEGSAGDLKRCKTQRLTGAYNAADWEFAAFPVVNGITGFSNGLIINASNQLSLEDRPQKAYGTVTYTDSFTGPLNIDKNIWTNRLLFPFRVLTILVINKGDYEKFLLYHINPYYNNVTGAVIGVNSTPKTICVPHVTGGSTFGIAETVGTVGHDIVTADAAHRIGILVRGIDTDGYLKITFFGVDTGTQSLNCDIYWMLS
jgi:hypothetical protein